MPGAPSSVLLFLVVRPGAPSSFLLLLHNLREVCVGEPFR